MTVSASLLNHNCSMIEKKSQSEKSQTIIVGIVLLICAIFLLWKADKGFVIHDESFFLTLGQRLLQGDHLFIHEWNSAQTTGLFTFPFVWIYTLITGNTDGIVLFVRYIFVFLWILTGIVLYCRFKQYGYISIAAVVCFLLFIPLDEMTISYNTVALSGTLIFSSYFLVEGSKFRDYLNGVVLALAVLIYPFLLLLYIAYSLLVLITNIRKKHRFSLGKLSRADVYFRISIGAVSMALLFALYICVTTGAENFVIGLKAMLPFMSGTGTTKSLYTFLRPIYDAFPLQSTIGLAILAISMIDRKRTNRRILYFVLQVILFVITIIGSITWNSRCWHGMMPPLAVVGLQCFMLTDRKDWKLFLGVFVSGVIYAGCAWLASDTGLLATATGFSISTIASLLLVQLFYDEIETGKSFSKNIVLFALILVVFVQGYCELYIRDNRNYLDASTSGLNEEITIGPAKGIKTSTKYYEDYMDKIEDINLIHQMTDNQDKFLAITLYPYLYLASDYEYGTFSSWTINGNDSSFEVRNARLESYYAINPDKKPDIIYVGYEEAEYLTEITCIDFTKYDQYNLQSGIFYLLKK